MDNKKDNVDVDVDYLKIESKEDLYKFKLLTTGDISDPNAYINTLEKNYSDLSRLIVWTFFSIVFCFFEYFKIIPLKVQNLIISVIFIYLFVGLIFGVNFHGKGYGNFWIDSSKKKYTKRIICARYVKRANILIIDSTGAGLFLLMAFLVRLIGD